MNEELKSKEAKHGLAMTSFLEEVFGTFPFLSRKFGVIDSDEDSTTFEVAIFLEDSKPDFDKERIYEQVKVSENEEGITIFEIVKGDGDLLEVDFHSFMLYTIADSLFCYSELRMGK